MPVSRAKGPERIPPTFDGLLAEFNVTSAERAACVWHLAMFRARKTVEALLDPKMAATNYGLRPPPRTSRTFPLAD